MNIDPYYIISYIWFSVVVSLLFIFLIRFIQFLFSIFGKGSTKSFYLQRLGKDTLFFLIPAVVLIVTAFMIVDKISITSGDTTPPNANEKLQYCLGFGQNKFVGDGNCTVVNQTCTGINWVYTPDSSEEDSCTCKNTDNKTVTGRVEKYVEEEEDRCLVY